MEKGEFCRKERVKEVYRDPRHETFCTTSENFRKIYKQRKKKKERKKEEEEEEEEEGERICFVLETKGGIHKKRGYGIITKKGRWNQIFQFKL